MWLVVWLVCGPAPPRASPALLSVLWASLVRVPLRFAKGTFAPEHLGFWRLGFCLDAFNWSAGLVGRFILVFGRGRLGPLLPLYEGSAEVIARARKMGSMGFAMETLPVPGFPGTSGLPRPPLQAEVCRAGGQSPRMTMRDR